MSTQAITEQSKAYANRWRGFIFIAISLLVISLDNTIMNVAVPSISRDLGASSSDLQWIIDAYILVFAAMLLTMGSVGDRYGRKLWLQIGLGLFAVGSLAAALSPNTDVLIFSRAFLGMAAAIVMPATLSLLTDSFPKEERAQAIALWAATFGLGVGVGPVIGGFLLESYSWHSVFTINLPVIAVALIGGQYYLSESRDPEAPPIDMPGVVLSIVGLFSLVYGIIEAGVDGWTAENVVIAFGAAAVFLGIFAWWENRTPYPMLPLYFFKNFSFTGANTALAFIMFSLFGSMFFFSQFLQTVQGYTALQAGVRLLPLALTLAVVSASSARVTKLLGTKYTVVLGMVIASGALMYMSQVLEVDSSYPTVVSGILVMASGLGLAVSPATDSVMSSVPPNKAGIGSAMNDTTRELGGAMGVALLGTFMNTHYIDGVEKLRGTLPPQFPSNTYDIIEGSIQAAHGFAASLLGQPTGAPPDAALQSLSDTIIRTADLSFVDGMTSAMFIGSLVMLAGALVVFVLLPNRATVAHADAEEVEGSSEGGVLDVAVSAGD